MYVHAYCVCVCANVYMYVHVSVLVESGEKRETKMGEGRGYVVNRKGECLTNDMSDSWCHSQNSQPNQ